MSMNILILSLAYAPYSGVGAARMTSLSKYLLDIGYSVTVICYDSTVFGDREQKRRIPEGVERICVEKLPEKKENRKNIQRTVERVIREKDFQICISSVGPYDTMFFIDKIWRKWKVPYVIDYRDPWLFEKTTIKPVGLLKYKLLIHDYLCKPIEKRVIKYASKIISVTEQCQKDLIERYHVNHDKCKVIFNGYEDVPVSTAVEKKDEFLIGVAGKFSEYNADAAEKFLNACNQLKTAFQIKVLHIGKREDLLAEKYPEIYYNVGEMNHKDTMEELTKTNALLVSYAHVSGLGTKVFDYIALNKPIIYVGVVPSELARFIDQFEYSYICTDLEQMQQAVKKIVQSKTFWLTKRDTWKYSRQYQNEQYGMLINEIISGK